MAPDPRTDGAAFKIKVEHVLPSRRAPMGAPFAVERLLEWYAGGLAIARSTTYKAWECARRTCRCLEIMHRRFEGWRSITGTASLITTLLQ